MSLSHQCYNVVPVVGNGRAAPVTMVTTDFPTFGDHLSGKIESKGYWT